MSLTPPSPRPLKRLPKGEGGSSRVDSLADAFVADQHSPCSIVHAANVDWPSTTTALITSRRRRRWPCSRPSPRSSTSSTPSSARCRRACLTAAIPMESPRCSCKRSTSPTPPSGRCRQAEGAAVRKNPASPPRPNCAPSARQRLTSRFGRRFTGIAAFLQVRHPCGSHRNCRLSSNTWPASPRPAAPCAESPRGVAAQHFTPSSEDQPLPEKVRDYRDGA